mgnify:CR=1 FL=1
MYAQLYLETVRNHLAYQILQSLFRDDFFSQERTEPWKL